MTSSAVPREYLKEPFIENVYLTFVVQITNRYEYPLETSELPFL